MAKLAKTQQQRISGWLNGVRNPSYNSIKKLADAVKVSVNYFIDDGKKNEQTNTSSSIMQFVNDKIKIIDTENNLLKKEIELLKEKNKNYENNLKRLEEKIKRVETTRLRS